ncbi:hypothetical protein RND81_02G159300 [Saponaria officinalis]|uniref:Protein kinase domain-containing protein n=1 Tax=Saponaria officinalis TaxID=3572 RepID=A0AAW1MUL8_SAPOF
MAVIAIIGAIAAVVIILVIVASIYCTMSPKTKANADILPTETFEAYENPIWKKTEVEHRESLESLANIAQSLKVYNFIELQYATDEFSTSSLISGTVYRGKMNGELAAIKKTKQDMSKEVNSLAKVSHFNIIQVLGVCFNDGYWYLVYEYASNGPLNDWIFSTNPNVKFLSWTQRVQIVLDVARGLNYIHSYNSPPYVCRDVKIGKILLDSNFRAKISNFSPVKSAEGQKSRVLSEKVYLSPEYRDKGHVSPKLDVYAFGILMLEVVSGQRFDVLHEKSNGKISEILVGVDTEERERKRLRSLVDRALKENYPTESAISIARLIKFCLNGDPSSRPDMDEVVKSLSKVLNSSMTWESSI